MSARAVLFLGLLVPVWAFGIVRAERITGYIAAVPPFFGEDLARFDSVRPQLQAPASVFLLFDATARHTYGQRFFAAQYSLAPTLVSLAFDVDAVAGGSWSGQPRLVLCVFDDPAQRTTALAALEGAARRRGLAYVAEPVDAVLTLVRLGGEPAP